MNIWFDGKNLHIQGDDEAPIIGIGFINGLQVNQNIRSDCKPCDRCHARQEGHDKILPFRAETLCADCIHKLKLLAYITEEK